MPALQGWIKLEAQLRERPSTAKIYNLYEEKHRLRNLSCYCETLKEYGVCNTLLIGEAPGCQGCAKCGIPFASEWQLAQGTHPFLTALRGRVTHEGISKEPTATIVWENLHREGPIPAFWNIFPFHAHQEGEPMSNRTPTALKIEEGLGILNTVVELLNPKRIVAVGVKARQGLERSSFAGDYDSVRHPAHGGKAEFIEGLARVKYCK